MTKDKIFNWKFCLCCGIFVWFVINLLQGLFTGIQEDEAYYALYGEHLAWGYFDHPPMVGLMTFLSSILFSGTLGVRFCTLIVSCLTVWVMWKIASAPELSVPEPVEGPTTKDVLLFFTLTFSVVMFNIYGFVTTPDVSLLLFSALFLLVYQRYLHENSWKNALFMGLLMACMIYSKYHAFLLLGLIVLSNLRLLKDGKFWVACLLTLVLLMPHILWQITADFPSFRYHLSGRSEPFRGSYFLEYLPNQLLIFNPFTFGAAVYVLFRYRSENQFERGLRFIVIGFFFFFWLMAFRGHVEPHWTIVSVIPLVVLVYRKALYDIKLRRYIRHFVLPSLLIIVAVRIALLTPTASHFGFSDKEDYYKAIATVADDNPVVFQGSFQQPALYHYFTGNECSTLRSYYDRKTQFDLWQFDKEWAGREVFVCSPMSGLSIPYRVGEVGFEGRLVRSFQSANRLNVDFQLVNIDNKDIPVFHHGDTLWMDFTVHNPYPASVNFHDSELKMTLNVLFPDLNIMLMCFHEPIPVLQPEETYQGRLFTIVNGDVPSGQHSVMLAIGDRVTLYAPESTTKEHNRTVRIDVK